MALSAHSTSSIANEIATARQADYVALVKYHGSGDPWRSQRHVTPKIGR